MPTLDEIESAAFKGAADFFRRISERRSREEFPQKSSLLVKTSEVRSTKKEFEEGRKPEKRTSSVSDVGQPCCRKWYSNPVTYTPEGCVST